MYLTADAAASAICTLLSPALAMCVISLVELPLFRLLVLRTDLAHAKCFSSLEGSKHMGHIAST